MEMRIARYVVCWQQLMFALHDMSHGKIAVVAAGGMSETGL